MTLANRRDFQTQLESSFYVLKGQPCREDCPTDPQCGIWLQGQLCSVFQPDSLAGCGLNSGDCLYILRHLVHGSRKRQYHLQDDKPEAQERINLDTVGKSNNKL